MIFTIHTFSQPSGWVWQNPLPQGNNLYGLTMFDANTGICINSESILRTVNGGENWDVYYTGVPSPNTNIFMVNNQTGYMLVDSARILKTINRGQNWSILSGQSPVKNASLYFLNETTGFAFGKNGSFHSVKMFKTTDGCISWNNVISDASFSIVAIQFLNNLTGYSSGTHSVYSNIYHSKLLKTTNGGSTWDSIPNAFRYQNTKICFQNINTGYIYGYPPANDARIYKTTNGGLNWTAINRNWSLGVAQIQFIDELNGFILYGPAVYQTTNGGLNWITHLITSEGITYSYINQIFFSDINTGYAVGNSGKVLKTTNSGVNWTLQSSGYLLDYELWDIQFSDNNTGFVISDLGKMLRTTNGGSNWDLLEFNPDLGFSSLAKVNSNTWYVSSWEGKILKTTNTGNSWDTTYANVYSPTRLEFVNEQTGFGVCKYNDFIKTTNGGVNWIVTAPFGAQNWALDFIDENTGFVGSDGGSMYKTTNGGTTWNLNHPNLNGHINDIQFIDAYTGYIASSYGTYGVLKTTNGGQYWQPILGGVYIVSDIYFSNERTGYAVSYNGMSGNHVFKTTNGGNNWYSIKTCTSNPLRAAYFANTATGWVIGVNGTIIKTTNGGESIPYNPPIEVPTSFYLFQNFPNPFNPVTTIRYGLPEENFVKIKVYDLLGRLVKQVVNENQPAGNYSVTFDGSNYASGVYFYTIETPEFIQSKKMVLLK